MRLMRGAGPAGLAVLAPQSRELLRPMIRARKSDIQFHLLRHAIPYTEDRSNADCRYLRARVRHELMPKLSVESPGIVKHLNSLADRMLEVTAGGRASSLGLGRSQAKICDEAFNILETERGNSTCRRLGFEARTKRNSHLSCFGASIDLLTWCRTDANYVLNPRHSLLVIDSSQCLGASPPRRAPGPPQANCSRWG